MTNLVTATVKHRFTASPERVFDAWLDPAKVRAWMKLPHPMMGMMDVRRVELDARVGGRFVFSDMREGGEAVHWGEYRTIDRPRLLVFTWWTSEEDEKADSSVVTLRFVPDGEGCLVTLEHSISAEWAEYVERIVQGWGGMFLQIQSLLAQA